MAVTMPMMANEEVSSPTDTSSVSQVTEDAEGSLNPGAVIIGHIADIHS